MEREGEGECVSAREEKLNNDRKPPWIRAQLPSGPSYQHVANMVKEGNLHTVCESARCPNIGECWSAGTATFMILGDICTRACGFCAVKTGIPIGLDRGEPLRVAQAIKKMEIKFAVITSVDRDDLDDGGSEIWADTIREVRRECPDTGIETLVPDFQGDQESLKAVIDARPDVLSHNLETVPRLYRTVRARSNYQRSLGVLKMIADSDVVAKTGIMVGIGEKPEEIFELLKDVADRNVGIMTIGQYLRPSLDHLPVDRWVHPDEFEQYKVKGKELGIRHIEAGPMVRSSYHAERHYEGLLGAVKKDAKTAISLS
ncbi:MAG: lipoyl synthase [Candidatus Lindowbacteria bacterium]|nr:lipoyl synthase [Candidatus Lindowbacteria bacterium]